MTLFQPSRSMDQNMTLSLFEYRDRTSLWMSSRDSEMKSVWSINYTETLCKHTKMISLTSDTLVNCKIKRLTLTPFSLKKDLMRR
jgi:hypothetical protein